METEMEVAREIQLSLLPKMPPRLHGLEISADSVPASQVGGDFYDFIHRPGEMLNFVIGDVSGKGMPAALLMSMTRTQIRTESNSSNSTPEDVLRRTNIDLYADFTELVMFASIFIGQYEPSSHNLWYANAGHSPVIYRPANGKAHLLIADGTPVGILPDSQSKNHCIEFNNGDVMIVGTDGLIDARSIRDERYGYDRLLACVDHLAHMPANAIAENLLQEIRDFSIGELQEDDQTLVVIKRADE